MAIDRKLKNLTSAARFNSFPQVLNANTSILPNNKVVWFPNDTGCDVHIGVDAALWTFSETQPTAIIASGCSVAEIPISLIASHYDVPVVSCSATSPELSNKILYNTFLCLVPPDNLQGLAWAAIARHYRYTSQSLTRAESNYAPTELECLGVHWAVYHFAKL